jgi:hypothetical protein
MLSLVKLVSGTELLGSVIDVQEGFIVVKDPIQISTFVRQNGTSGIVAQRYTPFSTQEEYSININHVESVCTPIAELNEYYTRALKLIKERIDVGMIEDLKNLDDLQETGSSKETYLAMLEKLMMKKPLN